MNFLLQNLTKYLFLITILTISTQSYNMFEPIVGNDHDGLEPRCIPREIAIIEAAARARLEEEREQKDIHSRKPPFMVVLADKKKKIINAKK